MPVTPLGVEMASKGLIPEQIAGLLAVALGSGLTVIGEAAVVPEAVKDVKHVPDRLATSTVTILPG